MVRAERTVFLFIGNDQYLKEEALEGIRSSLLGKSADRSSQTVFCGSELDEEEIFSRLNTIPLLSDAHLVVIKNIEKAPRTFHASLTDYIKKPSKVVYLVLDAQGDSILRDYKDVVNNINVRIVGAPVGGALTSWIKKYAASKKKVVSDGACTILRGLEGSGLSYIAGEMDKLIAFVGARPEIAADDAEMLIGRNMAVSAFDIVDAIKRKDAAAAMRICSSLVLSGKREYEIVGAISWYLKKILNSKAFKEKGQDDYAADSIEILLRTDLDIKRSRLNPRTALELALIRLCLL